MFVWALLLWEGVAGIIRGATPEASKTSLAGNPFSIQQENGIAWLVRPNGERFFSLGVDVVNMGVSREEFTPDNPGYAAWQYYADSNRWAEATLKRLKSWGFTTIGGWSDYPALMQNRKADVAFTPVLHMGATAGAPWWDMWAQRSSPKWNRSLEIRFSVCGMIRVYSVITATTRSAGGTPSCSG